MGDCIVHIKGIECYWNTILYCSVLFIFSSLVYKVLIIISLISQKKHVNLLNWLKQKKKKAKKKADQSGILS